MMHFVLYMNYPCNTCCPAPVCEKPIPLFNNKVAFVAIFVDLLLNNVQTSFNTIPQMIVAAVCHCLEVAFHIFGPDSDLISSFHLLKIQLVNVISRVV